MDKQVPAQGVYGAEENIAMLIDARAQGLPADGLTADVCIVGAGPAGLTLAGELTRAGISVCLLESGGDHAEAASQELNASEVDSPHGYGRRVLEEGRSRQLGGSASLWNHRWRGHAGRWIRYLPMDAIDFEQRDWVPGSGWPFGLDELLPFYESARTVCGVRRLDAAPPTNGSAVANNAPGPWETPSVEAVVAQFGQSGAFLRELPAALRRDERAVVVLHAMLKTLRPGPSGEAIETAEVVTPDGREHRVRARAFVLAAGGLENPRILLWHDALRRGGLGNAHDMVGRCFMDHPAVTLGRLRPFSDARFVQAGFYDQHFVDGQAVMGHLHLRPETMLREQMLNLSVALAPRLSGFAANVGLVARQLLAKGPQFLWRRGFPAAGAAPVVSVNAGTLWQRLLDGYYSECFCGWSELRRPEHRFRDFRVRCLVEQSADRSNRVLLDDDAAADAFGRKKIRLVWKWHEPELRTLRRAQEIFRTELAAAGIGEFIPEPERAEGSPFEFFSPHHFMGTTRMHNDPAHGVVDANSRVHGVGNLFVAGSSVFPTSGFANPTLTVIALALRLAGHLREKLREAPGVG